jgi:hypothetical protein
VIINAVRPRFCSELIALSLGPSGHETNQMSSYKNTVIVPFELAQLELRMCRRTSPALIEV